MECTCGRRLQYSRSMSGFTRIKFAIKTFWNWAQVPLCPGMVAAIVGGTVTLSDAAHLTGCLDNCYQSCVANNLQDEVRVVGLTWGQFDPGLLNLGRIDIILGSDCFYDPKDFEDILVTVSFLIERNPKCEFWTTYQDRSSDRTLEQLLHKWNLSCRQIPLVSFHADTVFIAGSTPTRESHHRDAHHIEM